MLGHDAGGNFAIVHNEQFRFADYLKAATDKKVSLNSRSIGFFECFLGSGILRIAHCYIFEPQDDWTWQAYFQELKRCYTKPYPNANVQSYPCDASDKEFFNAHITNV